jgi:hypothetical protein
MRRTTKPRWDGRRAAAVAALATFAWLAAAVPGPSQVVDRVVAVVGSGVITLSDARAMLAFGFVRPAGASPLAEAVDHLVNRQLILDEVNRYAEPAPDRALLDGRLDEVKKRLTDAAALQAAMNSTAMTELRLRDFVSDTLRIESYLGQRFNAQAQPSPDEVERYFQDHRDEFASGGDVPPFETVRERVQARVLVERRTALIADWLDRLRRRSTVVIK